MSDEVQVWSETVKIPTYKIGAPDKHPMFLEKRVYQGSSGAVYPHPVIDRVFDEKVDKEYTALYLENRYLKIMILPELGGHLIADNYNNGTPWRVGLKRFWPEALAQGLVVRFWPLRKGQMQNISTPMANRMEFEGEEILRLSSFTVIPEHAARLS